MTIQPAGAHLGGFPEAAGVGGIGALVEPRGHGQRGREIRRCRGRDRIDESRLAVVLGRPISRPPGRPDLVVDAAVLALHLEEPVQLPAHLVEELAGGVRRGLKAHDGPEVPERDPGGHDVLPVVSGVVPSARHGTPWAAGTPLAGIVEMACRMSEGRPVGDRHAAALVLEAAQGVPERLVVDAVADSERRRGQTLGRRDDVLAIRPDGAEVQQRHLVAGGRVARRGHAGLAFERHLPPWKALDAERTGNSSRDDGDLRVRWPVAQLVDADRRRAGAGGPDARRGGEDPGQGQHPAPRSASAHGPRSARAVVARPCSSGARRAEDSRISTRKSLRPRPIASH